MASASVTPPREGARKSLPLTAEDLADLDLIRRSPHARSAVGITEDMSEAMTLHALVAVGMRLAREADEAAAYAELAADPEQQAHDAAMRRRGRRRSETRDDA
jgi:hypothetical protein